MFRKFVGRAFERAFLDERHGSGDFEFIVIYGRRRMGKTELIKNFVTGKPHLYFLCDKAGTARNARRFRAQVAGYLDEPEIDTTDFTKIFSHLARRTAGQRLIVAMDEFSYLVDRDSAVPSIFQAVADEVLKHTDLFLILCGSSVSMMERGVLSGRSPLYGRKTGHIRLGRLPFGDYFKFYPGNDIVENIEFHAAIGGVPFYMERFSDDRSAVENIREQMLERGGYLYEEVDFLLREEMREPDVYKGILAAIADGTTKVSGIADRTGIRVQDLDKYLKVLNRLGLIARERPVTEPTGRRSLYCIDDNFVSTYFRFAEPFKSGLEIGDIEDARNKLERDFNEHVGRTFEKLVREEIVPRTGLVRTGAVGRWWGHRRDDGIRKEIEVDIAAIDTAGPTLLLGECKWKKDVDGEKLLHDLRGKAEFVTWNPPKGRNVRYLLVARTFRKTPEEHEARCLALTDIHELLHRKADSMHPRRCQPSRTAPPCPPGG